VVTLSASAAGGADREEENVLKQALWFLCAMAFSVVVGCGSDKPANPLAPFQPQIINQADDFAFQITNVQSLTTTVSYTWQNTGTQASVDHSSVVTNGSGNLTILDANGTQVYSSALVASGTDATAAGTTGAWTIRVVMTGMDADQVNFRVQKQ
jgi:hypothetical protein